MLKNYTFTTKAKILLSFLIAVLILVVVYSVRRLYQGHPFSFRPFIFLGIPLLFLVLQGLTYGNMVKKEPKEDDDDNDDLLGRESAFAAH